MFSDSRMCLPVIVNDADEVVGIPHVSYAVLSFEYAVTVQYAPKYPLFSTKDLF